MILCVIKKIVVVNSIFSGRYLIQTREAFLFKFEHPKKYKKLDYIRLEVRL